MAISNILHLGVKELRSLLRDPVLMIFIVYAFSLSIYAAATAMIDSLNNAPIAIVDDDRSPLSMRIVDAFYPPYFLPPVLIDQHEIDGRMDMGIDTFTLHIPSNFQRDLLAGHQPVIQLNIDATRMGQAFTGNNYVQSIVSGEIDAFVQRHRQESVTPVDLVLRAKFNPELNSQWFGAVMEVINNITMLSIILTGAALIREREHGTLEHLLVMPVTPFEIMASKVWAMALVVITATALSLWLVVQTWLAVPIQGSVWLFLLGTLFHLFATTSLGIFLGTVARSMPQFGILLVMILLPLQVLSGASTPRESMPDIIQYIMLLAPDTHFVILAQSILYRGAGFSEVWPQFLILLLLGGVLFGVSLSRFRKTIASMA